jgi:hypothetical protein
MVQFGDLQLVIQQLLNRVDCTLLSPKLFFLPTDPTRLSPLNFVLARYEALLPESITQHP